MTGRFEPKVSNASLEVTIVGTKRILYAVREAMLPEVRKSQRSDFSLRIARDGLLILHFSARDVVALRAGFNTNLRLVASALKTIQSAHKLDKGNFSEPRTQKD